jgi:uncharacterized protein YjbJ (UPF0337 family)
MAINWDIIKGKWSQFKGEGRKQWGKLTDSDWDQIAGEREKLVGRLQESYGWSRENAEKEADAFFERNNTATAVGEHR